MNDLTSMERKLSQEASKRLGYRVNVYRDGQWICEPFGTRKNGYGSTPEEAEKDCNNNN